MNPLKITLPMALGFLALLPLMILHRFLRRILGMVPVEASLGILFAAVVIACILWVRS